MTSYTSILAKGGHKQTCLSEELGKYGQDNPDVGENKVSPHKSDTTLH